MPKGRRCSSIWRLENWDFPWYGHFRPFPKKQVILMRKVRIWLSALTFLSTSSTMVPRPTFKVKVSKSDCKNGFPSSLATNTWVLAVRKWSRKASNKFTKAKQDGFNSSCWTSSSLCHRSIHFFPVCFHFTTCLVFSHTQELKYIKSMHDGTSDPNLWQAFEPHIPSAKHFRIKKFYNF